MEIRRALFNKKSIALFVLLFISNIVFFNYSILKNYGSVSNIEAAAVNYSITYENIENNIANYAGIPIFRDDESIQEGQKILKDYGKIRDVQGKVNDSAISLWFKSSVQNYLAMILCILIMFISFETENKGIFPVIHTTYGGRGRLAISHLFSVFLMTVTTNILFNLSLLVAAFIKTSDTGILSAPVQLSEGLEKVILPVTGIQFFVLVVLVSSGGLYVVALLCMLIMYLIHNRKIALTICGVIICIQYMLADWLPPQSKWSILKYINIMTLLDLKSIFAKYELYDVFGKCYELKELIYIVLFVAIAVLSVLCVIIKSKKYPFYKKSPVEVWGENLCCYGRRFVCRFSGINMELYKMLITQKGIVVITIVFLIFAKGIWQPVSPGEQVTLGSTEEYMADYYAEWTGPLNEDVLRDIDLRNQQMELLIDEENPAAGYYSNGLKMVRERIEYIETHNEKNLWLVNPSGYEYLIGDKWSDVSKLSYLIALTGIVTIIASVFSYEKKSDMEILISTTKDGRKGVKRRKYIMIYGLCTFMWLVISMMEVYTVIQTYSLDGLQAPVQSLSYMENLPLNVSIGGYLCLAYIYRLIVMLLIATTFIAISEKANNQEASLLLCGVVLLPAIMSIIGIDFFSAISVVNWIRLM